MPSRSTPALRSLVIALSLLLVLGTACPSESSVLGKGGGVNGSVHALVQVVTGEHVKPPERLIPLPDLEVFLRDAATRAEVAVVKTDLYGRYRFPTQPAGVYTLGWHAQQGWEAGTHPDPVVIISDTEFPVPARILPQKEGGVMFGSLSLADERSPWFYDELFSTESTGTVTVMNLARTATLAGPVRANAYGDYAVAGLPGGTDVVVRAESEASVLTRTTSADSVGFSGASEPADFRLQNHRPEILTIVADAGAGPVETAPPGATLKLTAVTQDLDGNPLSFDWKVLPGNGSLAPAGASATWTLPLASGVHSAYLQAADGKGGYARTRLDFKVGQTVERFSGRLVDLAGSPVEKAVVTANGVSTLSAANGFFLVEAPLADRYVLNIKKTGFALFSRVVDAGETGQTWRLVNAQVDVVDPKQVITLVDRRPQLDQRKLKGVRITIPANALVDKDGKPPAGSLTAFTATYDIGDGQAPGDWGALRDGSETNLISYGAGFVELQDSAGNAYNLAPGATAEVETFAPPGLLAGAPAELPLWSYDEDDGYWKVSGSAALDPAKGSFVGRVEHFSAFNTDLALDEAACLKVLLYPPLPTGVRLRMTDPTGTNFAQTFDFVLDRPLRGIYRVPANIEVKLQLFDADGIEYGNLVLEDEDGTVLAGGLVDTGDPIPPGETLWPDEPYETCKLVILRLDIEAEPSVFLTFKGTGTEAQALAYYNAVDPDHLRDTLGEWWSTNGFTLGADGWPDNAVRTSYLNYNDLGSGRDMHFRDLGNGHVAAFVTNYGDFDQDHGDADDAASRTDPGATVCMEFAPVEGDSTPIVKFFVYAGNGNGENAVLQPGADLDGFGVKYVPNLCNTCHGGDYYPDDAENPVAAELDMGARFRELDTATYKFPEGRIVPDDGEKDRFKQQNLMIAGAGSGIATDAILDLIAGWYPGTSTDQDNSFTPAGWSGAPESDVYHDLIKRSCRTCHYAFDNDASEFGLTWSTYDQLKRDQGVLSYYVLCEGRPMPHSVITYRNFWLSSAPHEPGVLRDFSDGGDWPQIGECE